MPTEESFVPLQKPKVQEELKRLYRIVFDNDRAAVGEMQDILEEM